jgi:hypothetical protein
MQHSCQHRKSCRLLLVRVCSLAAAGEFYDGTSIATWPARETKRPACVAPSARPGQHETECCSAIYFAFNKDFAPVRLNDLFHDREA